MRRLLVWCGMLFLGSPGLCALAGAELANPMRAPKALLRPDRPAPQAADGSLPTVVFDASLQFFQQVISPLDGARSTMYPTGSAYARQAFQKHGALLGVVLTTDRLLHEGNESQVAPRIRKYGLWRTYDPVEANDWWWYSPPWVYRSEPLDTLRR